MKNELDTLLQKEMDRKQFLKHVAIGFVSITGAAATIKVLNNFGDGKRSSSVSRGYGSSVYAGKPSPLQLQKS